MINLCNTVFKSLDILQVIRPKILSETPIRICEILRETCLDLNVDLNLPVDTLKPHVLAWRKIKGITSMTATFKSQPIHIDPKVENLLIPDKEIIVKDSVLGWNGLWYHRVFGWDFGDGTRKMYYLKPTDPIWVRNENLKTDFENALDFTSILKHTLHGIQAISRGFNSDSGAIVVETTDEYRWGIPDTWFGHPVVVYIVRWA